MKPTETEQVVKRCIDSYLIELKDNGCDVTCTDVPIKFIQDPTGRYVNIDGVECYLKWFVDVFKCKYQEAKFDVQLTEDYAIDLAKYYLKNREDDVEASADAVNETSDLVNVWLATLNSNGIATEPQTVPAYSFESYRNAAIAVYPDGDVSDARSRLVIFMSFVVGEVVRCVDRYPDDVNRCISECYDRATVFVNVLKDIWGSNDIDLLIDEPYLHDLIDTVLRYAPDR